MFDSSQLYKGTTLSNGNLEIPIQLSPTMSSSRFFASPKVNSVSYSLESRAHDVVQRLTCRIAQPEEIALEAVLSGASSFTNATRQADILGIVNSGFFMIVLGDIGHSFRSEVILYISKIFEHFWSVSIFSVTYIRA